MRAGSMEDGGSPPGKGLRSVDGKPSWWLLD